MVRLLVRSGKAAEDQNMLVRYLVKTAAFKTYPVCVLFDSQIKCFPVLSSPNVVFLNKVGPLAAVKPSYDVERGIVKSNRRVDIASRVKT